MFGSEKRSGECMMCVCRVVGRQKAREVRDSQVREGLCDTLEVSLLYSRNRSPDLCFGEIVSSVHVADGMQRAWLKAGKQ